jgi:hypothetical protein
VSKPAVDQLPAHWHLGNRLSALSHRIRLAPDYRSVSELEYQLKEEMPSSERLSHTSWLLAYPASQDAKASGEQELGQFAGESQWHSVFPQVLDLAKDVRKGAKIHLIGRPRSAFPKWTALNCPVQNGTERWASYSVGAHACSDLAQCGQ